MSARYRSVRGAVVVTGVAALLATPAALATAEGLAAAEQVSQASYYDYMDNWLFTHAGDDRGVGGADHDPCRDNIASLLTSYGFTVTIEPFNYSGGTYHNVVGTKTGTLYPNEEIVIGAHYDSVSNPGADDDASGVALILECARIVSQYPSDRTIRVCAFSREEQGLIGSAAYVSAHSGDNIIYMLEADMVAYDTGTDLARIYSRGGQIMNDLLAAYAEYGNGVTGWDAGWISASDHASFDSAGIDAALTIESEVWNNPYYHTQQDNFEQPGNLNFPFAVNMTRGAVGWLVDQAGVQVPVDRLAFAFPDGRPGLVDPAGGTTLRVEVSGLGTEVPDPGTGVLHYNRNDGGGWQSTAMTVVSSNIYDAFFPNAGCPSTMNYYVSAESVSGSTYTSPHSAPASSHEAPVHYGPLLVLDETFDTDPGWTTEGQWAFGTPTGGGGQYGNPDPTSGYTGSNVYGYNLTGDYENNLGETHLTTTAIDCSSLSSVTLRFQRYLGVEQPTYDHAYVRVSNNGTTWNTLWENTAVVTDSDWVMQEFDISAYAAGQSTVYLRWTIGPTDGSWQYCGWNIDDVQLFDVDCVGSGCPEDIDGLNGIGQGDLNAVLNRWGDAACAPGGAAHPCPEDLDGLNGVGQGDLNAVLNRWGDPACL